MEEELEEQEDEIWITNFRSALSVKNEINNFFNDEPRFNCFSSRNKLPRDKDGVYDLNLEDKNSKGMH